MRLLICGDRNWTDRNLIRRLIKLAVLRNTYGRPVTVIHGGARGADRIAGRIAVEYGLAVVVFYALWEKHGLAAGPIRNRRMLSEGHPDLVVGFHRDLARSRGTRDMLDISVGAGVPTYHHDGTTLRRYEITRSEVSNGTG